MQSYPPIDAQSTDVNGGMHRATSLSKTQSPNVEDVTQVVNEPTKFYSQFVDCMDMYADRDTVSRYLDVHHEWFGRCAHPMTAESIGENSYALIIGRYGSFGFEVEPRIGLNLLPQDKGVYRIETVPVPDYTPAGYEVSFRAAMELLELPVEPGHGAERSVAQADSSLPSGTITRVQWQLDLTVLIQFPRFIQALPRPLIQSTGDRVLQQVIRQVSGQLTRKVLEDFHSTHNLPIPKKSKRWFFQKQDEAQPKAREN
jgi:hypothetical protein